MAVSAYQNAADLMKQSTDIYSGLATQPGADASGQALGSQMLGLMPGSVTQAGTTVGQYGPADINAGIAGSMNQYLNPYYEKVIQASLGKMGEARDMSLNSLGASATAAGAFGGSRHGIAEGQIHSDYIKNAGELSANMNANNFNTALGAAQAGMGMDLNRGQYYSSAQGTMDQNKAGFDANAALQLGIARPGVLGQGYQIGMAADAQDQQRRAGAASGLGSAAGAYYGVGQDITNQQATQGSTVQQMLQKILSGGAEQFSSYMKSPYDAMNMMQAILQGDPRNNASTQTATTQSKPGILGALSAITGVMGAGRAA